MNEIVEKLRQASHALEAQGGAITFPGWDYDCAGASERAIYDRIRNAAQAVFNTTNYDSGIRVPRADVAALIRFLGDILEE